MFDFLNQNKEEGNEDVSFIEMIVEILKSVFEFFKDLFSGFGGEGE